MAADPMKQQTYHDISQVPKHVHLLVAKNGTYFQKVLETLQTTIAAEAVQIGIPDYENHPIVAQKFMLGRVSVEAAIEKWNFHWVAMLNLWKPQLNEEDQWMWVTNSFYKGEGTNAIVLSSEATFNGCKIQQPSRYSAWNICGTTPSKDSHVGWTPNDDICVLNAASFEELGYRTVEVLREKSIRERIRIKFSRLPDMGRTATLNRTT
jgi:hypothetical protein